MSPWLTQRFRCTHTGQVFTLNIYECSSTFPSGGFLSLTELSNKQTNKLGRNDRLAWEVCNPHSANTILPNTLKSHFNSSTHLLHQPVCDVAAGQTLEHPACACHLCSHSIRETSELKTHKCQKQETSCDSWTFGTFAFVQTANLLNGSRS